MRTRTCAAAARSPCPPSSALHGPRSASAGNAAAQERLDRGRGDREAGAPTPGPFAGDWLNGALGAAFGMDLGGLRARRGRGEPGEHGALACTRGREMSFGDEVGEDPEDLDAMEILAHETAHALAGGGAGASPVDLPGDPGEAGAHEAGHRFRDWAARGFDGPAPRLQPAHGGRATLHRYSTDPAQLTGNPMLRRGSQGDLVKTLQSVLDARGAQLAIDGIFGALTEAAVVAFQSSRGLEVDGIVGPQTAAALQSAGGGSTDAAQADGDDALVLTGAPLLMTGSTGPLVELLQTLLNQHGGRLAVDGDFGPATHAAVTGFQSANDLEVDGVVGPETAAALQSDTAQDIGSGADGASQTQSTFAGTEAYDDVRDAVLAAAATHLGALYWWGADGPGYFDCSGFVLYVLREDTGLISWGDDTAQGISNRLPSTRSPEKGDLVFFSSGGSIGHVEMCTGSGSGTIGASGGGSSTHGDDPDARVKWDDWNADSRSKSWGSIQGLVDAWLEARD